jgi:hypothetical protein
LEVVDEGGVSERVEIELTTRGDTGRRRRGRSAAPPQPVLGDQLAVQGEPGDIPPEAFRRALESEQAADGGVPPAERRRLVVTGLAAGAVALFIGWSLGRAGGDGTAATDDGGSLTSEAPATTIDGETLGEPMPTVDPALFPSPSLAPPSTGTVRRSTTTTATTQPISWILGQGRVDPRAAELAIRIVGFQQRGSIVELDTASGELASFDERVNLISAPLLWAGPDWILSAREDGEWAFFRGRDQPVTWAGVWGIFQQSGGDRLWALEPASGLSSTTRVVETTPDGQWTGREFELDQRFWPAGADPNGGLVVFGAPGGTYSVGPDGTSRITTGSLISLSDRIVVAVDCGETMQCGLVVIDRATGDSRSLTVRRSEPTTAPERPQYLESPASYGHPTLLTGISPDGRYSPLSVSDIDQDYGLVDLETGEFIQLGDYPESGVWWSPDSRSVMYLVNGHLTVFDLESRGTYEVSIDVYPLSAFAVRPAAQPAD